MGLREFCPMPGPMAALGWCCPALSWLCPTASPIGGVDIGLRGFCPTFGPVMVLGRSCPIASPIERSLQPEAHFAP